MACLHEVRDMDTHYIIDPITMQITNTNDVKNKLRQGDHDSEIFTFEIPKKIEGHDMSLCDRVRVHYINISSDKADQSKDIFDDTQMHVAEDNEETLVFQWKIDGNATKYNGSLNFRIQFACSNGNGGYSYVKWTEIFKGITIGEGFDNGEAVVEQHSDILEAWEQRLFGAVDTVEPLVLTDTSTGNKYQLCVTDGKLTMKEVTS